MGSPVDRAAYITEYDLFDRALVSERGIQVLKDTHGEAVKLRERLNSARALDREHNRRMYRDDPDDPRYANSEYAPIIIRILFDAKRGKWLCRLEKSSIEALDIEDIPAPEEEEDDTGGAD